eukprot:scaffold996_cov409-Prasinococcus_capsulatus_cf.AAC.8
MLHATVTDAAEVTRPTKLAHSHTFGHELRFALYLWYEAPALSIGFSVRPPPAIWPTMALHALGSTFFAPDGNFTRDVPFSKL